MGMSSFSSFSFSFSSFLKLFVRPPQTINHFAFLHFFSWEWSWSPPPVQCHEPPSIVLQALCLLDLIPWIYLSLPVYNCKGFDLVWGFPSGSEVKASASNVGNPGLIPGLGRSPGEGNDNPLQYSCLENPMDRGAWRATVHGITKSQTQLCN